MLLTGSAGGGKSRLAAEKIHAYCKKYPGTSALMVRKTRESMTNSTVLFMDRKVIGDDPDVRHFPSYHRFQYHNGSILIYGGMKNDEQREQIRSIGQDGALDIAWMEEAAKFVEDDYNEILARIRGTAAPWNQVILSTNPDAPAHWINKRLIIGGEAVTYFSSAIDNSNNSPEYMETLKKLTGVLGKRLRDGKWVQAEGVVYEEYDPAIHLIDPFEIPIDWRRFRAFDFGYENPFVCQWWAMDHDGRLYRYREIYMTHRTVPQHIPQIIACTGKEQIEYSVADHDAEDVAMLKGSQIPTVPARKAVSTGIQAVKERLAIQGDGKPRIFLLKDSLVEADPRLIDAHKPLCTEEEISVYSWLRRGGGEIVKDEPLKENDHGMDPMRYMVMAADQPIAFLGKQKSTRTKPVTAGLRDRRF